MKIEFPVEGFYEAELCECGGYFNERIGNTNVLTYPIKAEFKCNKCGCIEVLYEKDFPGVKFRIIGTDI